MLGWKYLMIPDWSTVAMYVRVGITISCAWNPEDSFKVECQ